MAAEVFGAGVDDQIEPEVDWITPPWGRKGIVDDGNKIVFLCQRCHGLKVTNLDDRVSDCFNIENLGVLLDCGLVRGRIAHIRHCNFYAEAWEIFCHQTIGPTVAIGACNHVITFGK